ncbi:MAG TPA: Pr6Pr family membrane protein [Candidatus Saccharibacteria bacterium]|nr:Pr6Pr family membrane protein [Candidatus Saccharibacteria bacterium]
MFLISYKIFFALLSFGAVVTEIATLVERGYFTPLNFFSYFTIQTNILVFVTLLLSALALAAGRERRLDVLRSAVTVYILVVGIGFSLLLARMEGLVLTAVPWDNTVLHYIIPAAMLVDFLIDRPKRALSFKKSLVWLLFPVLYVTYALMRGAMTGWYPYPFLNPATSGYGSVALTVIGLFVLGLILIAVVTWLTVSKKRSKA